MYNREQTLLPFFFFVACVLGERTGLSQFGREHTSLPLIDSLLKHGREIIVSFLTELSFLWTQAPWLQILPMLKTVLTFFFEV